MAWSTAEEQRVKNLEAAFNELQIAVTNLATKQQMRQLLLIKQAEVEALETRIETLESQIAILQSQNT